MVDPLYSESTKSFDGDSDSNTTLNYYSIFILNLFSLTLFYVTFCALC